MGPLNGNGAMTLWQLLALPDEELEQADVVVLNLAVAKEIPSLAKLQISNYVNVVDDWTAQFRRVLPSMEVQFRQTPERWRNDIRLFRVGMLQGFLGHEIGLRYIEEQKTATAVSYTNPGDLFLNGLIDTKRGTCGNMAALHVAMARRMGWPVSLACAKTHFLSRFDDGQVIHNIEATSTHPGSFASDSDDYYIQKHKLPRKAITCGSDLRKLTAREMIGAFLSLRGRHYQDTDRMVKADQTFALARAVFPQYRRAYIAGMIPMLTRGQTLFDPDELGHPNSLFRDFAQKMAPGVWSSLASTHRTVPVPPTVQTISLPSQSSSHVQIIDAVGVPWASVQQCETRNKER
jgi:hypothetical protein